MYFVIKSHIGEYTRTLKSRITCHLRRDFAHEGLLENISRFVISGIVPA